MSWQPYIDNQIRKHVNARIVVIYGIQDGGIWAKYEAAGITSPVTPEEMKLISDTMSSKPEKFQERGVYIGGEKFFCISAENNLVRGRKQSQALCIVPTNKCLIACATADGFPPGQLNSVVEKLADYLKSLDF